MPETLQVTIENKIATIAFNRQDAMNSFNKLMADELEEVTEQIAADNSVRAVLLKGAGKLFMAGGDLNFFYENLDSMPQGVMKIVRTLNASIINLMHMPKPILASVHGSVAGVGISLMMACDLVIAAEQTKFTMAYSKIGISPDGGATYNLPRIVGVRKAMEWLMLSELFDAQDALQHGLINWVVPLDKLEEETNSLLKKLVSSPTQSIAHVKRLVNQSWQLGLQSHLENEGRAFEFCASTEDFKKGVTAFLNKKGVEFSGK